jgi:hypothetical protein
LQNAFELTTFIWFWVWWQILLFKKKMLALYSSVDLEAFHSIYPCRFPSSVEWSVDDEAQVVGYNSV